MGYYGALITIDVLKIGVLLRLKSGVDPDGEAVPLAKEFRCRFKGGIGAEIIRMKTQDAEWGIVVKFLALELVAVTVVTA